MVALRYRDQATRLLAEWPGWAPPAAWRSDRVVLDDRSHCLQCGGAGCPSCRGSGHVCPTCRGVRYLRREWLPQRPVTSVREPEDRCPACRVPSEEARAIAAYLAERQAE
jgi:hypothetical protein